MTAAALAPLRYLWRRIRAWELRIMIRWVEEDIAIERAQRHPCGAKIRFWQRCLADLRCQLARLEQPHRAAPTAARQP